MGAKVRKKMQSLRRAGEAMTFGSVRQACISRRKLLPPPPSVLWLELM